MSGAGQYPSRVERYTYTPTLNTSNGQDVPHWTASGTYYWCRIEESNGRRQTDYGTVRTGADATLYVRNYPQLGAQDHVVDSDGNRWVIDTIASGDNEFVVEAHRFDTEVPLPVEA